MNYKMIISYDGAKYKGWQRNKGDTVQGKIEEILAKYFDAKVLITAAGRTDAGAHAKGQVANFKIGRKVDTGKFKKEINHFLPADIVVLDVTRADDRFHSRFNTVSKTYTYTIWKFSAPHPPLFERKYVYQYDQKIDTALLESAAKKFLGKHDFKGFSSDKTKKSTLRNVQNITVTEDDFTVKISIKGDGFLYNMVRIMTGTLLEIASGDMNADVINKVFESGIRETAGVTVPAQGLCLDEVEY